MSPSVQLPEKCVQVPNIDINEVLKVVIGFVEAFQGESDS